MGKKYSKSFSARAWPLLLIVSFMLEVLPIPGKIATYLFWGVLIIWVILLIVIDYFPCYLNDKKI